MFKIPNKFADVFILSIVPEKEQIVYTVRDKDTGVLVEPLRTTKFVINEVDRMVHFDARVVSLDIFQRAYQVLS